MTTELTQLDRATRFAIRVRATPPDATAILKGEDLLDAKAVGLEFERLLNDAVKRADHARSIGKKGGRPRKPGRPTKAAKAKRISRAKAKPQEP